MNREDFATISLTVFAVALISYCVWYVATDISTGKDFIKIATISDKHHSRHSSDEAITDSHGKILGYRTSITNYYYIHYTRQDGISDRIDVHDEYRFRNFVVGQKILVKGVIGGRSGREYLRGIEPYIGAESR